MPPQQNGEGTVLITGGNGYLGSAMAEGLAQDGNNIVIAYFTKHGLDETIERIRKHGVKAIGVAMDIRRHASVEDGFQRASRELETPSGVIACSAVQENVEAGKIPLSILKEVIETNVLGSANTFEIGLRCIAQSRQRMNRFLGAIGSVTARQSFPGMSIYGATKNFVDGMVRTYALPAAKVGARTWSVRPGAIPHEGKETETPGYLDAWKTFGVLQRIGTPQDVASAVRFLASSQAAHITGTVMDVDGGNGVHFEPPIREVQEPKAALRRFHTMHRSAAEELRNGRQRNGK